MPSLRDLFRQTQNPNESHNSTIPGREFLYQGLMFLDSGGSKVMSINGAPTDFFIAPPTTEIWFVEHITLVLIHTGDMDFNVFAALGTALTTGLEIIVSYDGNEKTITNLKDNIDISQCFFGGITNSQSGAPTDPGFLNNFDTVTGRMEFKANIVLDGSENDKMIFRISDNLSTLDFMGAAAQIKIPRIIAKT